MIRRALLLGCLASLPLTPLPAQSSRNVNLLGRFDPGSRSSDVWGYVDRATGREYALLGTMAGTWVLDTSDPTQPTVRGSIPTDSPGSALNRWVDIKSFGTFAYVVSEAYGGMQIVDLSDPDHPTKVTTWGASRWANAHNLAIDRDLGVAYVCGTNTGMHVLDVAANPTSPTPITTLTGIYVHDLSVQHGRAYLAEINANRFDVDDVSALPALQPLASVVSVAGGAACHSTWPTRDDTLVAVCHEINGGPLVLYDVTQPRLPVVRSVYQTGGAGAVVHNPMVRDRIVHVAWNTEGYQALDVSDPDHPVRVGEYDTWVGPSTGFDGLWGVYALQPSGVIYGSDRSLGLLLFRPRCVSTDYGAASPGSTTPRLLAFGAAYQGNGRFRLDLEGAGAGAAGVLLVGIAAGNRTVQGLRLLVDLGQSHVVLPFTADAQGTAKLAVPVPLASAAGAKLYAQALTVDPQGPLGVAASAGLTFEVIAPAP